MLDVEIFSLTDFDCSPAEILSLLLVVVLIFFSVFWLSTLEVFLFGVGVSLATAGFFLGLSLLVSKELSPKDLYPRRVSTPNTGIEVSPPIAISNSLNAIAHFS